MSDDINAIQKLVVFLQTSLESLELNWRKIIIKEVIAVQRHVHELNKDSGQHKIRPKEAKKGEVCRILISDNQQMCNGIALISPVTLKTSIWNEVEN